MRRIGGRHRKREFPAFLVCTCHENSVLLYPTFIDRLLTSKVRKYVEGTKESVKLLDLLSAAGDNEIEPTKAASAGRGALYPDVSLIYFSISPYFSRPLIS